MKQTATIALFLALIIPYFAEAATPAPWPSSSTTYLWVPYRDASNFVIQDPDDMSPDYLDIVYSLPDPVSVYVAYDGSTAFFRMQLQESPVSSNGNWSNGTWMVQFGQSTSGLVGTLYLNVNGQNGTLSLTDGVDTDEIYGFTKNNPSPDGVRVSQVPSATTYYLDFQVPIAALYSGTNVNLGLTQTTILSFFYGTSTASGNPSQISKDLMYGTTVNFNAIQDATFGDIGGGMLPVELESFNAYAKSGVTELRWTTSTEINNHGFAIERSFDGTNWEDIGFVSGSGTSNVKRSYAFSDSRIPDAAAALSYRLRQIDRDGSVEYSPVVIVKLRNHSAAAITDAYPNPFNPTTTLSFTLNEESSVSLALVDATGRTVKTVLSGAGMAAGSHAVTVEASDLPSGRYLALLQTPTTSSLYPVVLMK